MTIRKTTAVKAKVLGSASPTRIHVPTAATHCHPSVVIVASPSRARLLHAQVNRALEALHHEDAAMDSDGANKGDAEALLDGAHCGESAPAAYASPGKRVFASTATIGSPTAVVQISPNAVKRKRSHSLVTAPSSSSSSSSSSAVVVSSPALSATSILTTTLSDTTPPVGVELRVDMDAIAASPHSRMVTKRSMKARDGRVTPSKRCGGKEKKKKQKVDVIERALKRFRTDMKQQQEDDSASAQFSFEFASVCHRDDSDGRTSVATPRAGVDTANSLHRSGELAACQPMSVQVGVAAAQGARAYMEDRFSVVARLFDQHEQRHEIQNHASLLAMYDGHNGVLAADYAARRFHELLAESELLLDLCKRPAFVSLSDDDVERVEALLKDVFEAVDDEIVELTMSEGKRDGATVLLGLLLCGKLFVANLGDTRGVLGTTTSAGNGDNETMLDADASDDVVRVSVDHKPDLQAETERVEEAGGKVIFSGCWRVAHDEIPLRLAVSRSLGDHPLKANLPLSCSAPLVSVVPDIQVLDVSGAAGDVIVFATDGLWDRLSDEDAVRIARTKIAEFNALQRQQPPPQTPMVTRNAMQAAAIALVETALVKRSMDNITAMVIGFSSPHRLDNVEHRVALDDEEDDADL